MTHLEAGDPAPAFTAEDETGRTWRLEELQGTPVVLYFYPRDDTPGCTKEACAFQERLDAFETEDAQILGVSDDDAESHAAFKEKHGLTFPLLVDEDAAVSEAYGTWVEKKMFGKTFMGVQRATFLIDADGTLARVWPKVQVDGHAEEVLAALDEL